jgi:maltooligosyltrehalose synthase
VVRSVLAGRAARPAAFRSRTYVPFEARGASAAHVVAFGRGEGGERLVAAIPRLLARRISEGGSPTDPALWTDTVVSLPDGWPSRWTCVISGRSHHIEPGVGLRAADLFGVVPVALLLTDTETRATELT